MGEGPAQCEVKDSSRGLALWESGMVTGEGEDSLAVEGSKLKGLRGEVEAWYNDESRGEATGKSAV